MLFDPVSQFLQPFAHQLMVITPQCIAGNHSFLTLLKQGLNIAGGFRQVIQTHGNHPDGARVQFGRPAATCPVALHIIHLTVKALVQPAVQKFLVFAKLGIAYTELLKTQFLTPGTKLLCQHSHFRL